MRVLLDECIPRKLKTALAGYDCQTVPEAGLAGQKNGGLQYQQNLAGRRIAILIVRAKSNRLKDLLPHVEACRSIMGLIHPGEVTRVRDRRAIARLAMQPPAYASTPFTTFPCTSVSRKCRP